MTEAEARAYFKTHARLLHDGFPPMCHYGWTILNLEAITRQQLWRLFWAKVKETP